MILCNNCCIFLMLGDDKHASSHLALLSWFKVRALSYLNCHLGETILQDLTNGMETYRLKHILYITSKTYP